MYPVHYNPKSNSLKRRSSADRLFDGFFDDFAAPFFSHSLQPQMSAASNLKVDIYEKDNVIVVDADMPGIAKEDIKLDVKGKNLTIGYERKDEKEVKDDQLYRKEKRYGKFERTFSMPFEINAEKVSAKYENGVLKLEIPKPEEQQQKTIEIQ